MGPKKVPINYNDLNEDELIIELTAKEVKKELIVEKRTIESEKIPTALITAKINNFTAELVPIQKEIDIIKKVINTIFIQPDLDDITNKATEVIEANADKPADYADKAVRAINIATGATGSSATGATGSSAITLAPLISDIYQPHAQYIVNLLLHQLSAKIQITNTVTDSSSNVTRTLLINAVDASNNTTTEFIPKDATTINIPP